MVVGMSTEKERRKDEPSDPVGERLFTSRTVLLFGEITMESAHAVSAQLLALAAAGSAPIRLVVNSPGGHVESGDTLHDVLRFIDVDVRVLGTGWVASAAALVYCAVPREKRFCLPNTRFLLHQPLGGVGGKVSDVEIEAAEMVKMRERLQHIFAEATGQPVERLARDMDRNHWLSASEALAYGLCGGIVRRASELG